MAKKEKRSIKSLGAAVLSGELVRNALSQAPPKSAESKAIFFQNPKMIHTSKCEKTASLEVKEFHSRCGVCKSYCALTRSPKS